MTKKELKKMTIEDYHESTNVMVPQGYEVVFGETSEGKKFTEIRDHRDHLGDVLRPGMFDFVLYGLEFAFISAPTWFTSQAAGANILEATLMSMIPQGITYTVSTIRRAYNSLKGKNLGTIRRYPKIIGRRIEDSGKDLGEHLKTFTGRW